MHSGWLFIDPVIRRGSDGLDAFAPQRVRFSIDFVDIEPTFLDFLVDFSVDVGRILQAAGSTEDDMDELPLADQIYFLATSSRYDLLPHATSNCLFSPQFRPAIPIENADRKCTIPILRTFCPQSSIFNRNSGNCALCP